MDKQTFESLKKVADRLNKLERSEKEFLLKDWPKLMKDLTDFEVKGDELLLNGKKIYEFYVPKDGKDGADGKAGKDGERGPAGKDGIDGKSGRDGRDGKDGKDGREIILFIQDNKLCWSYENSDEIYELIGLDKLKGKDGKDGKDGKRGGGGASTEVAKQLKEMQEQISKLQQEVEELKSGTTIETATPEQIADLLEISDVNADSDLTITTPDSLNINFSMNDKGELIVSESYSNIEFGIKDNNLEVQY